MLTSQIEYKPMLKQANKIKRDWKSLFTLLRKFFFEPLGDEALEVGEATFLFGPSGLPERSSSKLRKSRDDFPVV